MALTTNLVSYWKLDESSGNAADSVGANTLTNNNTVGYAAAKINNGADGGSSNTDKSLSRDGNTPAGISYAQFVTAWSISLWMNETTQGSNKKFTGMQVSDGSNRRNMQLTSDSGTLKVNVYDGTANSYTTAQSLSTGTWYHVVYTYDGTDIRIYLNGTLVLTQSRSFSQQNDSQAGGFGLVADRQNNSSVDFFSGLVDEVGIWSRALSAGEVSQLYNGGNGSQYAFTTVTMAYDSSSSGGSASSPATFSHTCTGDNRILFVAAASNSGQTVTGVTYAGVSMTQIGSKTDSAGPTEYLFYLIAPATGANNVIVSTSGSNATGASVSYTGVKQSGQPDASVVGSESTTTHKTQALTSVANNCWFVATTRTGNGFTMTGDAGTVVRVQAEQVYLGANTLWDSNSAKTPAGSYTLGVTSSSQLYGGVIMASIAPFTSNVTNGNFLSLL